MSISTPYNKGGGVIDEQAFIDIIEKRMEWDLPISTYEMELYKQIMREREKEK